MFGKHYDSKKLSNLIKQQIKSYLVNNLYRIIDDIIYYTQKRADIVDIPSVYHLVISPGQGDISSAQGDITFTL